MATKQAVWGIDVGQCALKAIKLQAAGDKIEVLAYDVVEHEKILSHPEVDAAALIKAALEKFVSRNEIKGDLVAVAVAGQQTLSRFTKLPPVEPKKIPDIVKFEAGQQIPFDMDEVVWDYQTFSEPNSPDVEVGIFAIRKELIRNHIEYFTKAGIEPILVQAAPLALYNAMRFDKPAADKATILLDVGAQATDLIVVEGSSIWARPVPIGGNAFTEALVKAFKLSHGKAENLKRTAASTKYARQVFQAMRPVFSDLIAEVQRSIGFYTATHRESQVTRIIGVGNAFKLPGLQKFMQQNLQIEVERFATFSRTVPSPTVNATEFADAAGSLVIAYGLALQGLGIAPVASSLLPPEIARQLVWRKKLPFFWAAAACLALGAGVIWGANARAQAAIDNLGRSDGIAPQTVEQAETILRGSPGGPPREYAGQVAKALQKLSSDYSQLESGPGQDVLIDLFQKTGANIPLVPRVYNAIHQALHAEAPGIAGVQDGQAYLQKIDDAARRRDELIKSGVAATDPQITALDEIIERAKRREIWIDEYAMDARIDIGADVKQFFPSDQDGARALANHPGWLIQFQARTTRPEAAGWIEDIVLPRLERDCRKPGMGFYVCKAASLGITPIVSADAANPQRGDAPPPPPNIPRGPRDGGPPRDGGRGRPPQGPGTPPQPGSPQRGYEVPPGCDPLTLEKYVGNDSQFTIVVLVVRENTPADLLAKMAAATQPGKTKTPPNPAPPPGRSRP